ncbi:hypothetical protein KEM54_000389 [Ascosphaera aggregata]|nr:hypothetical protein KEM54_000389 [Ascosphaera aggregata]
MQPYQLPWSDLDRGLVSTLEDPEIFIGDSRPALIYQAGLEEIGRLDKYPSLYPDPFLRMRFTALTEEIRSRKERAGKMRELLVKANEISREEDDVIEEINRPMFQPRLKPWEQFLLKDSPGSGLTIPHHPPHVLYQVMPFAGALLKERWCKTTKAVERKIRSAVLPSHIPRREEPKIGPQIRDYEVTDNLENFSDLIGKDDKIKK